MSSDSFRQKLRQEATQWQTEGLISPDQLQQLSDRYQFEQLDTDARDRFVSILLIIGGLLLGIGVITFVAANWQAIPRFLKVLLLLSLLIGANVSGFLLWRSPRSRSRDSVSQPSTRPSIDQPLADQPSAHNPSRDREQWQQRLGHGLLIFGALTLGANLALMGQMFHQDGSAFGLCLIWGLGVLSMAYGLQLASLGIIAVILVSVGFWTVVFNASVLIQGSLLQIICQYMPLVMGILFLPLAYQRRSRLLFAITAIGVMSSFEAVVSSIGNRAGDTGGVLWAIALSLPIVLLWAYQDSFWGLGSRILPMSPSRQSGDGDAASLGIQTESESDSRRLFQPVARAIAFLWLSVAVYGMSFNFWIYSRLPVDRSLSERWAVFVPLLINPNLLILAGLAIAFWVHLGWPRVGNQWRLTLTDGTILLINLLIGVLIVWHGTMWSIGVFGTLIFNILLFLLSAGAMREGLSNGDRKQFWVGFVLMIV
ncbi:MAG: DUF2157 domain-containing protein, partial [Elainellaceae cyanobacterium]